MTLFSYDISDDVMMVWWALGSKFMHFICGVVKSLDSHFLLVRGELSVCGVQAAAGTNTPLPSWSFIFVAAAVVMVTVVGRVRSHRLVLQLQLGLVHHGA